jgi:hypothetical protein
MDPAKERYFEAHKLLDLIIPSEDKLTEKEKDFCRSIWENCVKWGMATKVSQKQIFWLRDIKDKYL